MLRGLPLAILLSAPTPTRPAMSGVPLAILLTTPTRPAMSGVDNLLAAATVRARLAEPGGPITTIRVEADFVTCTQ